MFIISGDDLQDPSLDPVGLNSTSLGDYPGDNPLLKTQFNQLQAFPQINSGNEFTEEKSSQLWRSHPLEQQNTDVSVISESICAQVQHFENRLSTTVTDPLTGLDRNQRWIARNDLREPRSAQTVFGRLEMGDDLNPTRALRFKDDYVLQSETNSQIQLDMVSEDLDTYLQVIDTRNQSIVAVDNNGGTDTNSQLIFTAQAGVQYFVRATSFFAFESGDYSLSANIVSVQPTTPPDSDIPSISPGQDFSLTFGYGLVDASAVVAQALNLQSPFSAVSTTNISWSNNLVNAPEVWASGYTGEDIIVAVVDTGVDYSHPDLNDNIWQNPGEIEGNGIDDDRNGFVDDIRGWNFIDNINDPIDRNGHGTHVAGTIAAENNAFGITGVAFDATIMPVQALGENGSGSSVAIANGIRYAADNGAHVINLSLGSDFYNSTIESAVQYASGLGSIVVSAAGNSSRSQPGYPALFALSEGLSVGAVDRNGRIASFSNRAGSNPDLLHVVAPGVNVQSTLPNNQYGALNGTSMAAPHVAGVVALLLSAKPNLNNEQVRELFATTSVLNNVA